MLTGCYRKIQIPMNSGSTRTSRSDADFKITLQGWTLDAAASEHNAPQGETKTEQLRRVECLALRSRAILRTG
jgi:hypothetical protein